MSDIFETAIVEKRNVLNELRSNNLTLQELRFFSIYLSKINPYNADTRKVKFKLSDFQKIMDFKKLNIVQLKAATDSLLTKIVHIPKESGGYTAFQIFKECEVDKDELDEWYVSIDAHDKALPLMFDFKDRYFKYELWNALRLKSANQIRMYEILKQYETIGKREIRVDDLRELLGIAPNEYPRWNNFRTRVLDSCQQALKETTDICYTYDRGKTGTGGKWLTVIFSIYQNEPTNKQIALFVKDLENSIFSNQLQEIVVSEEKNEEQLSDDLQSMILFADDLTKNEIKEIYYAMQEKGYSDLFMSFKRLYQTAVNNDPDNLKKYILGIIKNDVIRKNEKPETENDSAKPLDSDVEKYKVLINRF